MKRFLRCLAMLWPLRKLSAFGNQLSATYKKYKRKQLNNYKRCYNKLTGKIGRKPLGTAFMCADPCQAPALPGLGLALGAVMLLFTAFSNQGNAHPWASEPIDSIKPLRVGDYVPEDFWKREFLIYNHGDSLRTDLAAYQGKLIILDFWATWCGYCIQAFPTLGDLQKEFDGSVEIILVNSRYTKDGFEKIDAESSQIFKLIRPWSIIEDEYLYRLFPHGPIPHYVWINPSGRIIAITFKEFVNKAEVGNVINFYGGKR